MKIDRDEQTFIFAPVRHTGEMISPETVEAILDAALKAGLQNVRASIGHGFGQVTQCSVSINLDGVFARDFIRRESETCHRSGWFMRWNSWTPPSDDEIMLFQMLLPSGV